MGAQRAALRLLFVVLVAAGVAGMHTLGHLSSGGHGGAHHTSMPADGVTTGAVSVGQASVRGPDMGLDPSTVCLAILTAFGLAALLAALLTGGRPAAPPGRHPRDALILAGRGPPPLPFGLRLAELSVLRR